VKVAKEGTQLNGSCKRRAENLLKEEYNDDDNNDNGNNYVQIPEGGSLQIPRIQAEPYELVTSVC